MTERLTIHKNPATPWPAGRNWRIAVGFDFDSTISHTFHREHLAPAENREALESWIAYSQACIDDDVIEGVAAAVRLYYQAGLYIFFTSGRNEEAIAETIAWLAKHNIPWHEIKLHDEYDPRHNGEHKVRHIKDLQRRGWDVRLFHEDHVSVCETIEAETGVPCITVRPRYEDGVGVSFNLGQYADANFTELSK